MLKVVKNQKKNTTTFERKSDFNSEFRSLEKEKNKKVKTKGKRIGKDIDIKNRIKDLHILRIVLL